MEQRADRRYDENENDNDNLKDSQTLVKRLKEKDVCDDDDDDDDDEFWNVAMLDESTGYFDNIKNNVLDAGDDDDDDFDLDDDSTGGPVNSKHVLYRIQLDPGKDDSTATAIDLHLAPLPPTDGIWSPVGADAWYASALLTALLLLRNDSFNGEEKTTKMHGILLRHLLTFHQEQQQQKQQKQQQSTKDVRNKKYLSNTFKVLELGSGAVGLSGLACAAGLEYYHSNHSETRGMIKEKEKRNNKVPFEVILTDNDRDVLIQLQKNVDDNRHVIFPSMDLLRSSTTSVATTAAASTTTTTMIPENNLEQTSKMSQISVHYLDWSDVDCNGTTNMTSKGNISDSKRNKKLSFELKNDDIQLVIGSELVYTKETAIAFIHIVTELIKKNPNVEIWVVQVTDRFGWNEIVLPTFMDDDNTDINDDKSDYRRDDDFDNDDTHKQESSDSASGSIRIERVPIPFEVYEMASTMIPMGGTLDRHAYGAYCIYRHDNNRQQEKTTSTNKQQNKYIK